MTRSTLPILSLALAGAVACGGSADAVDPVAPADPAPASAPALAFDVFVADEPGFLATSTLITSGGSAVLVDAQFNLSNGRRLAAWIRGKGVRLEAIYITHAHPDHYFGAAPVLEAFPDTPVFATPAVIEHMREIEPGKLAYWGNIYGDDLTERPVAPTPLARPYLELAGHRLDIIALPQGDAAPTTIVYAKALGLVVAGDLTYQGVHPWLAEVPATAQRQAWLSSLDQVRALSPRHVVAGHRIASADSTTASLDETAAYLRDFERLRAEQPDAAGLIAAMTELYGARALPIILELSAKAAY